MDQYEQAWLEVNKKAFFSFSGVFLIGPGNQGILYEHREMEFGDHHNSTELLAALEKINIGDNKVPDS